MKKDEDVKKLGYFVKNNGSYKARGGIFLIVLILTLIQISIVSAQINWDNVKNYDEQTKTVDIRNSVLGIPFLQLSKVADVTLLTPQVNYVIRGKDRLVAEFEINNVDVYTNVFNEMEFYDLNKNSQSISRQFTYKYQVVTGTEEVPIYEDVCEKQLQLNGSNMDVCTQKQTGTKTRQLTEWRVLDTKTELPKGIIHIGVFTDVKAGDKVEWIPTLFGVKIDEWAEWTESLDNGLVAYWSMDTTYNTTNIEDQVTGTHNSTTFISGFVYNTTNCKLGNCTTWDGGDGNYIKYSSELEPAQNLTICSWVKTNSDGAYRTIISRDQSAAALTYILRKTNGNKFAFYAYTGANVGVIGKTTPDASTFYFVCGMYNSTDVSIWVNGTQENQAAQTGNLDYATTPNQPVDMGFIYLLGSPTQYFVKEMDEVGFWNRSLTASEITQLYNGGVGMTYTRDFSNPPTVTLNSPENYYNSSSITIDFNCSAIDNIEVVNASLFIDGARNYTEPGIGAATLELTQSLNFIDGTHTWTCNAYDDNSDVGWAASNFTFTVNTTPDIHFIAPTPDSYTNQSYNSIYVNVSLTETYFKNVTFYLYSGAGGLSDSQTYTDATRSHNFTAIADGSYNISATTWTTTGQSNSTENRTVNIDTNSPAVNITELGNIDYHISGDNLTINWSVEDSHIDSCILEYAGVNQTVTCSNNGTYINATSYDYKDVILWANDTFGNSNSSTMSWDYKLFQDSISYNPVVIEGSLEPFSLDMHTYLTPLISRLNYNGTSYSSTTTSLGSGEYNVTNNIPIPNFVVDTNTTFHFNITYNEGTSILTNDYTQLVQASLLDNCSVYTYLLFNISLYDEKTLDSIVGDIETDLNFLNQDNATNLNNLSVNFENVSNAEICSNTNLTGEPFLYNFEIRYSVPSGVSSYEYVPEFYHIQHGNPSDLPLIINLYDLNVNESTEFTLKYRDDNYVAREGVLLQILRKYVSEGIYRIVEIPITSNDGSAIAHLDTNNYKYKIIATLNGEILNVFDNPAVICEGAITGVCTINLNGKGSPNPYQNEDDIQDLAYSITQNGTKIYVDYTVPSGVPKEVSVAMTQTSPLSDDNVICNTTLISSSGSFECTANSTIGDSEVLIEISFGDQIRRAKAYFQEDLGDFFLLNNYIIGAFLLILLITMMVSSPKIMVAIGTFGVAILGLLFLIKGSSIGLVLGTMSWLIVAGILILIKINNKDET